MKSSLTQSFLFLIMAVGFLSAHAAPATTSAPAIEKVSICIPHFREEFLTLAVMTARDQGFFAKNGLEVTLVPTKPSTTKHRRHKPFYHGDVPPNLLNDFSVATTLSESSDVCQFGTSNVERFLANEKDDIQTGTIPLLLSSYGKDYDTNLVVLTNSKIKTIADLKGKTIRLGQAPVRMALEGILREAGLKMTDINQNYAVPSTDVLAKLESGKIDAAVTYVPTMPYMLATGKVRVLKSNIVKNYLGASVPHSLVIANRKFAAQSPATVKRFIAAVNQASDYIRRNPTEAISALSRNSAVLGHKKPWVVEKVTVEKAGEFVGKITTLDLFDSAESRVEAQTMLKNYGGMLKAHNLITHPPDLSPWLGVDQKDSKVTSL